MAQSDLSPVTPEELQIAFDLAEDETARQYSERTCSLMDKDGNETCPICFFRQRVKNHLKIIDVDLVVDPKALLQKRQATLVATVNLERKREFAWRLWISLQLIHLASWIAWAKFEQEEDEINSPSRQT